MTVDEHDFAKMIAEVEATSWRLRETIRVEELAATHSLAQMRRLLMLEEQKAWKRESGFDRIEKAAEMDEKRFRTSLVSDPFFYRNVSNPRRPHTPDEFTLEMKVDVKRLRMEIILSQLAPPQWDPLPRRATVNTGSEESRTPRRSPAIGTGSDEPGVLRFETSTDTEEIFPLETSMDGFCIQIAQAPRAGVYSVSARRRGRRRERNYRYFTISHCSRGVRENNEEAAATKDDSIDYPAKQAIEPRSVNSEIITFVKRGMFCRMHCFACCSPCVCLLSTVVFFLSCPQYPEAGTKGDRSDWDISDA